MVNSESLPRAPRSALFVVLSALLSLGVAMPEQADATGARELAAGIVGVAGRLDLARLVVRESKRAEASDAAEFQRALEAELRRLGFGLDATTGATIEVTLSDSFQGPVAVAEIRSGDTKTVAMILRPRGQQAPASDRVTPVTLQLQPLLMRGEPILDVLPVEESLLVLGTDNLVLRQTGESDSGRQVAAVTRNQPCPRDPRGRIWSDGVSVRVYLPGTQCRGTLRPLTLACADSPEAWPLDGGNAKLVQDRNYFEAEGFRPFYSMVRVGTADAPRRLIAGIDGKSYLYNSNGESIAVIDGLGSDLAAVQTSCGSGTQILAALPGEEGDLLQAFEWIDVRATAACAPVRTSGSITALWPAASGASAIMVTHNIEAGRYEAYRITVACSR